MSATEAAEVGSAKSAFHAVLVSTSNATLLVATATAVVSKVPQKVPVYPVAQTQALFVQVPPFKQPASETQVVQAAVAGEPPVPDWPVGQATQAPADP